MSIDPFAHLNEGACNGVCHAWACTDCTAFSHANHFYNFVIFYDFEFHTVTYPIRYRASDPNVEVSS